MYNAVIAAAAAGESANPLLPAVYDIVWSSVIFVVILFFFWKLVLPKMQKLLDDRAEAGQIREHARADGQKIIAEHKDQALAEAARVTASAKAQIEAERQAAVVSLRSEVGTLAIDLASGVIGESLTDDAKASAIVDRFLADLEASEKAAK
jgi:F-type H+-transporting ATPase subunit b